MNFIEKIIECSICVFWVLFGVAIAAYTILLILGYN